MTKEKDRFEELLVESFYVAIDAADPHKVVPPHIPSTFQGDVVVVGAGKAAASMAAAGGAGLAGKRFNGRGDYAPRPFGGDS